VTVSPCEVEYEEGIAMASQVLMRISKDEAERARLMSEYKYVVDTQSKVVQAKREGKLEGRREGKLEGRREGKLEGRREGKLEGRLEEKREVAKNLKNMGVSQKQIQTATGLSADEIAKL
jgi:predicted transposase YdaD